MRLVVRKIDDLPAANVEVVRSLKSYKFIGDYRKDEPIRTDINGVVNLPARSTRLPVAFQAFLWIMAFEPHGVPYTGGRVHSRDNTNYNIWDDVGFDEDHCCPSVLTLQQHDFALTDSIFY